MPNLNSFVTKIMNKADTLGTLYGYLAPMTKVPEFAGDPIGAIMHEHQQLLTGFRMPTLDSIRWHIDAFTKDAFKIALMAYLGGEIVNGFNAKWGNGLKKFGEGVAKGAVGSTLVMSMGGGGYPGNPNKSSARAQRNVGYGY